MSPLGTRFLGVALAAALTVPATAGGAAPRTVAPTSPADSAREAFIPPFEWSAAKGADRYEFQLAADERFGSIVLGRGTGRGAYTTRNLAATISEALADGTYFWRVRALSAKGTAGKWSGTRRLTKAWTEAPTPMSPPSGATVTWPGEPLMLRWGSVARAVTYEVTVATDPGLTAPVFRTVETTGTVYAPPVTLASGTYYWGVRPVDAQGHPGTRSAVSSFTWSWPSGTSPTVADLNDDVRVYDPQFAWTPVPGAGSYQVEVSKSEDFAPGSRVCCTGATVATTLSPTAVLENNRYFWRVRAIDAAGHAGQWNLGPSFTKAFDDVTPTIPGLRMRDNVADPAADADPGTPVLDTSVPVLDWEPVPGASSYEAQVTARTPSGCDWSMPLSADFTQNTSLTPLGATRGRIGPSDWPTAWEEGEYLRSGQQYCARVLARSAAGVAISDWTQVNGPGQTAFRYVTPSAPSQSPQSGTPREAYNGPAPGSVEPRMPLFTWDAVPGAKGYYVVVSKDRTSDGGFTNPIDVAFTRIPAYAPRAARASGGAYPDETTSYFWVVIPAMNADGTGVTSSVQDNSPQPFEKRSVPPALLGPPRDAALATPPTFRWTSAEGARDYRLQISLDPTFANPIEDVRTGSTAYTSSAPYPPDTPIHWRVRATDDSGKVGLTWSPVSTFRRNLPAPQPLGNVATEGEAIPALGWTPVPGAVGYGVLVDQPDGTRKSFTVSSAAFTPIGHYGTGVWRWRVRALFPTTGPDPTPGPYSAQVPFTRRILAPTGARGEFRGNRMLIAWDPRATAKRYRVEISRNNSFTQVIESTRTDHPAWAPTLSSSQFAAGGTLFWRVAVVDDGGNAGAYSTGTFALPQSLRIAVTKRLGRGARKITVKVTDGSGKAVKGARVRLSGTPLRGITKRTGRTGRAAFKVRLKRKGTITVQASRKGMRSARATIRVR